MRHSRRHATDPLGSPDNGSTACRGEDRPFSLVFLTSGRYNRNYPAPPDGAGPRSDGFNDFAKLEGECRVSSSVTEVSSRRPQTLEVWDDHAVRCTFVRPTSVIILA